MPTKNEHMNINLKSFTIFGLWPFDIDNQSSIPNRLHEIYSLLIRAYFLTVLMTQYYEIYMVATQNIFELLNNLSVSLLYTVTIVKVAICRSKRVEGFVRAIFSVEERILSDQNTDQQTKGIYREHVKWNRNVCRFMITLTSVTLMMFYASPLLLQVISPIVPLTEMADDNLTVIYNARPLPFSSWFPFDRYKYYKQAYFLHIIFGIIGGAFTCTTDIMFWSLMIYGVGQMKLLQYSIRYFRQIAENMQNGGQNGAQFSIDDQIVQVVKKCVIDHQTIIEYIDELNAGLNMLMFLDFLIAAMQIATIGFQVVVMGFGLPQMFALEYLIAMLIQMILFYWHANELLLESVNVTDAVWESDWYNSSNSVKKSLYIIMIRSKKALTVNVGPFYAMSTQTALAIVRASYSYVALMRQMYVRKMENND